ncbi:MAG: diguanylate cyclase [Phycisphaerales bacterium]
MPLAPDTASLLISAPFGNYVRFDGATSTLGTFTAHKRPGRLWKIVTTVRRYKRLGAWVNRIGLRNPGIEWLERRVRSGRQDVSRSLVSVHGFTDEQWWTLLTKADQLGAAGIELNMSCPNVGEVNWPVSLFERAVSLRTPVVVKLPPVRYERLLDDALAAGVGMLHCCNTLPVPGGGMSGKPLKPIALACVSDVRTRCGANVVIVGGGGITRPEDIDAYADAGANRFAIGSVLMHPRYLAGPGPMRGVIARAAERAS